MIDAIIQLGGFLIIGAVIGVVARLLKPGKENLSFVKTIGLGMAAAIIGGIIASFIGKGSITELNFWGFLIALIAAILLLGVLESSAGKKKKKQTS